MFGLFRKKDRREVMRGDYEIGEFRQTFLEATRLIKDLDGYEDYEEDDLDDPERTRWQLRFTRKGLRYHVNMLIGDAVYTEVDIAGVSDLDIYRCMDHVSRSVMGARCYVDRAQGKLMIGMRGAGFERYRIDALYDIAVYIAEDAANHALKFLGRPYREVPPLQVGTWEGGYRADESLRRYRSAAEAFVVFAEASERMVKTGQEGNITFLRCGPVTYEVVSPGWPCGFQLRTGTRGFREAMQDPEKYLRIQQAISEASYVRPHMPDEPPIYLRGDDGLVTVYFDDNGDCVITTFCLANAKSDISVGLGNAYTWMVDATACMNELVASLPDDLYRDA